MRALILASLLGCGRDKADYEEDDEEDCACAITAAAEYPIDGQEDAYYRGSVEFELSEADPTATIALMDADGAEIQGFSYFNEDGDVAYFTPAAPLAPSAAYTARIDWCGGGCDPQSEEIAFTTSALGEPLEADLVGKTYLLDLRAGRWVEPRGVGDLLGDLFTRSLLLEVLAADGNLALRLACSQEDAAEQGTCFPTIESFIADFSQAPFFADPPETGDILLECAFPSVHEASLAGTFAADGSYIGGGELRGAMDAREVGPLLPYELEDTSPEYMCELLVGFGISCSETCADGEPYCFPVHVDLLTAEETSAPLEPIFAAQCHEGCEASCENAECPEAESFPVCL